MNAVVALAPTPLARLDDDQALKPVHINFEYYLAMRPRVLAHCSDMPNYLLLPEVSRLLNATLNDRHRLLFDFLWHTGARITEALSVRPRDLELDTPLNSIVSLQTLKQRTASRKKVSRLPRRAVPLIEPGFILDLKRYIETHRIKRLSPLFELSRQAVDNALKKWSAGLEPPLSIDVSAHTLRHSFAINHVLHGQDIHLIKTWLGHTSMKSTMIYLNVLGFDTNHIAVRTRFR